MKVQQDLHTALGAAAVAGGAEATTAALLEAFRAQSSEQRAAGPRRVESAELSGSKS